MVVHFPIALIITAFVFDMIWLLNKKDVILSKIGYYLMIAGTVTLAFAFTTGYVAAMSLTESKVKAVMERHETYGLITLFIMVIASMIRLYLVNKKMEESKYMWLMYGIYFIGVVSLVITGLLGGHMVFNFMVVR